MENQDIHKKIASLGVNKIDASDCCAESYMRIFLDIIKHLMSDETITLSQEERKILAQKASETGHYFTQEQFKHLPFGINAAPSRSDIVSHPPCELSDIFC